MLRHVAGLHQNLFISGSPTLLIHNVGLVNEDVVTSAFASVLLMLSGRVQITVITVSQMKTSTL